VAEPAPPDTAVSRRRSACTPRQTIRRPLRGCSEPYVHAPFCIHEWRAGEFEVHWRKNVKTPLTRSADSCGRIDRSEGRPRKDRSKLRAIPSNRHLRDRICFGFQKQHLTEAGGVNVDSSLQRVR
jgi:hypothetical protein